MSYISKQSPGLAGGCGSCGRGCGCGACRERSVNLGERYVREEEEDEQAPPSTPRPAVMPSANAAAGRMSGWGLGAPFAGWRGLSGLADSITATHPRTSAQCRADERRIRPIVEPPQSELVNVERRHLADPSRPKQLHRAAYAAYVRMKSAAESDGIAPRLLTITSGYRGVAHQRTLWEAALRRYGSPQAARRWVAPPGGSPHHTGRAIDLALGTPNNSNNIPALRATLPYRWLVCNAARFGFFPYAAEPWHWEFNPAAAPASAAPAQQPAASPGAPSRPVRIPTPEEVARRMVPLEPETPEERVQRIITTPPPAPRPRRSFNQMFWRKVDDQLDSTMSRMQVPQSLRARIRSAAHAAIEKGAHSLLDRALDQTRLGSEAKEAIRSSVRAAASQPLEGWNLGLVPPAGPVFRFECPDVDAATRTQRSATLRQALRDAIDLATNAARSLEASPRAATTIARFQALFGHPPTRPVPWAGNAESGAIVARRFRIVARELRSRNTLYRCTACTESTTPECPLDTPTIPCPLNARTLRPYTLNTVELCPRFWTQSAVWRAGILLHEMLHLYFGQFFRHAPNDPERRRDNAHCYEAFAVQIAGSVPDQCDVCRCRRRPA